MQNTHFSQVQITYILGHKASLSKFNWFETTESFFFKRKVVKLEINSKINLENSEIHENEIVHSKYSMGQKRNLRKNQIYIK